ncbi:Transcription elongation factor B polypeptide 1 [Papilio xuthus]|uniref:Elongin-C n=2 Tax=Papilio xuthus TaxID=66420 RepID=A0A194QGT1_PAPXU|nr:Transcription elongation factor B polypeptide 1 [Papilio xuthus]
MIARRAILDSVVALARHDGRKHFCHIDDMSESTVATGGSTVSVEEQRSLGTAAGSVGDERVYGGCEGPDAMYVKLVSSDGHEFIVKREHALTSGTIKAMLSGPGQFAENEANEVNFREIPSHVLQKVCMYFTYKVRYTNSSTEIPEFPIAPEIALELLMAANFLDC